MDIPYYIFLLIYGVGVLVCVVFFFINLYHLRRYGLLDFSSTTQTLMVSGIFIIVLVFTFIFLRDIQWTDEVHLLSDWSIEALDE